MNTIIIKWLALLELFLPRSYLNSRCLIQGKPIYNDVNHCGVGLLSRDHTRIYLFLAQDQARCVWRTRKNTSRSSIMNRYDTRSQCDKNFSLSLSQESKLRVGSSFLRDSVVTDFSVDYGNKGSAYVLRGSFVPLHCRGVLGLKFICLAQLILLLVGCKRRTKSIYLILFRTLSGASLWARDSEQAYGGEMRRSSFDITTMRYMVDRLKPRTFVGTTLVTADSIRSDTHPLGLLWESSKSLSNRIFASKTSGDGTVYSSLGLRALV